MSKSSPVLLVRYISSEGVLGHQRNRNLRQCLNALSEDSKKHIVIELLGPHFEKTLAKDFPDITFLLNNKNIRENIKKNEVPMTHEMLLDEVYVSPNFLEYGVVEILKNVDADVLIPENLIIYGDFDKLINFHKQPLEVLAFSASLGYLSPYVPIIFSLKYPLDRDMPPIMTLGQRSVHGAAITVLPGTIYFSKFEKEPPITERYWMDNELFSPSLFSKLHQEGSLVEPSSQNQNKPISSTEKALRLFRDNYPTTFEYIKGQYHLNRHFIANTKRALLKGKAVSPRTNIQTELISELHKINSSVLKQWAMLNEIEPMIRPSADILRKVDISDVGNELFARRYAKFCYEYTQTPFKHIVMVPHLVRGGADLAALNFIKALASNGYQVLVIISLEVESPWIEKAVSIDGVTVLEAREWFAGIDEEYRATFVARIAKQWKVERLSVINSSLGYRLLRDYGVSLRTFCKTLLHTYAFDMTNDGFIFNVLRNGLVDALPGTDLYVTDCKAYKEQLREVYGFADAKVKELYIPTEGWREHDSRIKRRVLWASRISEAKLIETAVEIGAMLAKEGIELHFYGALDEEYARNDYFEGLIKQYSNIKYHGIYDGLSSINTDDYDIFLLTTKNEGMPNVLLEAALSNLFLIAPRVGGIPEIIVNHKNGVIVEDRFMAKEYFDAVLSFYAGTLNDDPMQRTKVNHSIQHRHSWDSYALQVQSLLYGEQTKIN